MKKLILLFFILFPLTSFSANLVLNSGFETDANGDGVPDNWVKNSPDGISLIQGPNGKCARLVNASNRYIELNQDIPIDSKTIKQITVKSKIKISNVIKFKEEWEMARVMVLFFDAKGNQVGGWPELGRWKGTFDWSEKVNVLNVPENAAKITLQVQLANCIGEMQADDISVEPGDNLQIPRAKDDLLMNGDMEFGSSTPFYWGGWVNGEGTFEAPGYESPSCFKITNKSKAYSMITQKVPVVPEKMFVVILSGMIKTENIIQGGNPWDKARISILFLDSAGNRVGGWPAVAGETAETISEWTKWENNYPVPEGTAFIEVSAGLLDCAGTIYIDKLRLEARDRNGKVYQNVEIKQEDRSSWRVFNPVQDPFTPDAVIDLTYLQDAPAGKHGFIKAGPDGSLIFEDGTKTAFWGTNLMGPSIFRSKEDVDLTVKRLSKSGCNLVRLHHMDAPWSVPNIFESGADNTRNFSKDSLDKLDYLIFKLKEAGIYVFLDFLVHRELKSGDGADNFKTVPRGFKEIIFIDDKLQDLTYEYIEKLLEHENRYTKVKYLHEPAIIFSEIVNESSLFYADRNKDLSPAAIKKLDEKFNEFLKHKYGSDEKLKEAWLKSGCALQENESLDKKSVAREQFKINWGSWDTMFEAVCNGRASDTKRFYAETEKKFYDKMINRLKEKGYKALLTGSNHWELWDAELALNAQYDFIDRHSYWDHPSGGWSMRETINFSNSPVLKSRLNTVAELAHCRMLGKPFTVSEWNWLLPNRYRSGAPVIMSAYAKLQGWNAMMQFEFGTVTPQNILENFTDFSRSPEALSQWIPAALIFRNNYLSESKTSTVSYLSEDDLYNNPATAFKLAGGSYEAPLLMKAAKTLDESKKTADAPEVDSEAASDTGELFWNLDDGIFRINAPKIQGATGFLKGVKLKFKNFNLKCLTNYASVYLYSLDGKNINESGKIILHTSGISDNSSVKYSPAGNSVIYGGSSPIIIEPVLTEITFNPGKYRTMKIFRVDSNGYRQAEYKNITARDGKIIIKTDANSGAMDFLIEVKRRK
ncbi:MAG: hypothetical protein CVV21_11045 [Candidatus Goldiibacteriota bacterium HGW-Goldbacteria-1]|jgi:hypothetical protein|nr:MAG: hypothetical protein CVV21_11045 [Candidatus Goldiibacteriota bacterium HGW-Goldbacteria-1]